MNLFFDDFKINKPLVLIELFAGYGSQALAFKKLGFPFSHGFVCEYDKYAIKSYNAIHGTNYEPTDIRNIHADDLNITDTDANCYMMTYSFPCTDISVAGKMAAVKDGLKKGSSTRSGLLWEVERLLEELSEKSKNGKNYLPQILFMENVPGTITLDGFSDWCDYLRSKGYSNHIDVLNAKDYGIPQNRDRAFMFSFLGDFDYEFPKPIKLQTKLKDILETDVDEKFYINNEKAEKLIEELIENGTLPTHNRTEQNRTEQNRTEQDLHSRESLSSVIENDRHCNNIDGERLQGIEQLRLKCRDRIPCKLDKMPEGKLCSLKDSKVCDVGTETASTITARYYKGIAGHKDNMVIET